jgi:hypothetical protein
VAAEPSGVIHGHVVNRTASPRAVAGQTVRLEIVERGSTSNRDTATDARGGFAFTGLPLGGDVPRVFLVTTRYQGVPYEARLELTAAAPVRTVDLDVFEATQDRTAVRGTVAFAVLDVSQGAVRISVVQRLENDTARAVISSGSDPLTFPLPPGAEAVELIGGWQHPEVGRGAITDAMAVPPGVLQVGYAYGLEPRARRLSLAWSLPYGAREVDLLVGDPALGVTGPGVRSAGVLVASGRRFARWSAGPVDRGGQAVFTIDGLTPPDDRWPVIAAAVLALLLAGGLAAALRPRHAAR